MRLGFRGKLVALFALLVIGAQLATFAAVELALMGGGVESPVPAGHAFGVRIVLWSAIAGALCLLLALAVARYLSRPLDGLVEAAERIERGDYSRELPVRGHDELAQLAATFNRMQEAIAQREQWVLQQASLDALTGLPNRIRAVHDIDSALERARGHEHRFALLVVDVDRFKEINDVLGHAFGDQVLVEIAERLRAAVPPLGRVARLGGDEFLVVLEGADQADAEQHAARLIAALRTWREGRGPQVGVPASVGIALFPEQGGNADTLLRRAEIAMHDAKRARDSIALYRSGRDEQHLRQLALMRDLRQAIQRQEFHIEYQPKVDLRTRSVAHAEALLRWSHGELGSVCPDEFIPLAERSGFVPQLTRHVLEEAIAQIGHWRAQDLELGVAVNLSVEDLADSQLGSFIAECLARHAVPAERLMLEVTESALMHDVVRAIAVLHELRTLGVRLAIDDFGIGHSSLAQLKRLPVQELKIDKSFVTQLSESSEDVLIVRSTIELGHSLGLSVIAEGVETPAALDMLRDLRCDLVQGFLLSPPLPSEQLATWCRAFRQAA